MHHPGDMWVRSGIRKPTAFLLAFLLLIAPFTSVFAEELNVAPGQIESTPESNSGSTADGLSGNSLTLNVSDEVPIDSTSDSLTQSETLENELFDVQPTSSDDASSDSFDLAQLNEKKENGGEETLLQAAAQGGSWGSTGPSNSYPSFTYAPQTPKVEQSTGALTFAVPILVPPGRNGMEPSLSLTYSSQNLEDGIFGYGFRISIPHIEVINRRGVNVMYSDGYFSSSLLGELGTTTTPNEYRAKIEDGSFLKYTRSTSPSGSSWTMTDKRGTAYTFGASSQSRQDNPSNPTQVFKWMLEEIRDTNANFVRFEYAKDQGEIYPSKIIYTGNGVADGIYTVEFIRTPRPDVRTSYRSGFLVRTASRITEIQTQASGTWLRKYILNYASGSNGYRSLLNSVTESGKDETTGVVTTLPPTQFEYAKDPVTYAHVPYPMTGPESPAHVISDIDGNGLQDLTIAYDETGTIRNFMQFNQGQGQFPNSTTLHFSNYWGRQYSGPGGYVPEEKGTRFFDVNGDGASDVVQSRYSYITQSFNRSFLLNQNDVRNGGSLGFTSQLNSSQFPDFSIEDFGRNSTAGLLGNLNGDGLTDFVRTSSFSVPGGANGGWLNTGSGMFQSGAYVPVDVLPMFGFDTVDSRLVDINADSLDDWVFNSANTIKVCFNNGLNWPTADNCVNSFTIGTTSVDQYGHDKGVRFLDINGDGLVDFVRAYHMEPYIRVGEGAYPAEIANINFVMLNTGNGFATSTFRAPEAIVYGAPSPDGTWNERWTRSEMWDWSGDQIPEKQNNYNTIRTSDVLSKISYGSGGSTSAEYEYTSQQYNKHKRLPFPQLVVKKLIMNDGIQNLSEILYSYDNGYFYYAGPYDRKFAGFEVITERRPEKIIKTHFHQGDTSNSLYGEGSDQFAKIGRPYRVDVLDASTEALMSRSLLTYNVLSQGQNRFYVSNTAQVEQQYNGDNMHRDTALTSLYDATNGNLVSVTNWGEVVAATDGSFTDVLSDKTTTEFTYASGSNVIDFPSSEIVKNQDGTKIAETRTYYDDLPHGAILKGNATKREDWISGALYKVTSRTYDSLGSVKTETDARSNTTRFTYDPMGLRVTQTENPLLHTKLYTYDLSSGKVTTVVDENGHTTEILFDGLDRNIQSKIPDSLAPGVRILSETRTYVDVPLQNSIGVRTFLTDSTNVESYIYFDGLGRKIQEKREGEGSVNFVTSDYFYDSSGRVIRETLPYFSTGSSKTTPSTNTNLFIDYGYDSLDRAISVQNVTGQKTTSFDDWIKTDIDQLGNRKSFESDARGNLVRVTEYLDDVPLTTNYTYDSNRNLTKITDALGNIRSFAYDALGRRLTAEDLHAPNDATFTTHAFAYDAAGNMTSKLDGLGRTTAYTYDSLNRVLTEDDTSAAGIDVIFGYDACTFGKGKLCSATTSAGSIVATYGYTPLGLIQNETKKISGVSYTTSYAYDRQGNKLTQTNPDGSQVLHAYDSAGLLDQVSYKAGVSSPAESVVAAVSYSPTFKVAAITYGNGIVENNSYDENELYRLRTITAGPQSSPTSLQNSNYSYDAVGNILSINDTSLTNRRGLSTFVYDDLYRLTSATKSNATTTLFAETYSYNALGNILSKTGQGSYSYSGAGYANPHAPTAIGTTTLSYDQNGNLLSAGKSKYAWDYRNRLTQWGNGSATSTYLYDVANTRMTQTTAGVTTAYPTKYYTENTQSKSTSIFAPFSQSEEKLLGLISTSLITTVSTSTATSTSTTTTQTIGSTDFKTAQTIVQSTGFTNLTTSTIGSSDNTYATSRVSNPVGRLSNFGFVIPANASIRGIEINFEAKRGYGSAVIPFSLSWNNGTTFTATKSKTITASELTHVYGSATDTWGRAWTPAEFGNSIFQVKVDPPGSLATLSYDLIRVKIHYGIASTTSSTTVTTTTSTSTATTTATFFIHADHLGSTGVVTNASGTVVQVLDYYPYGGKSISSGTDVSQREFIGERYDDQSGLSYLNARYYEGSRGQFLSQDPVFWGAQNIADPQSMNSYSYALGNPINRKDPSGESSILAALQSVVSTFKSLISSLFGNTNGSGTVGSQSFTTKPAAVTLTTQGTTKTTTWNSASDKMISQLDPRVRQPATNLINETESKLGVRLIVVPRTGGFRSIEEQNETYAQGRTKPGNIVTRAPGGRSYHNYGLAVDVAITEGGKYMPNIPASEEIGKIGEAQGFVWGGRWTIERDGIHDPAHFQMTFGQSVDQLYSDYLNSE